MARSANFHPTGRELVPHSRVSDVLSETRVVFESRAVLTRRRLRPSLRSDSAPDVAGERVDGQG